MPDVLILIPARMASTRLPGKPLADIAGEPMIVHVWRRAMEAKVGPVWVATDSAGGRRGGGKGRRPAVMTRPDHASGTDRIHEALAKVDPARQRDIIVNMQGDLPTLKPADLAAAVALLGRPRCRYRHAWPPRSVEAQERDRSERGQGGGYAGGGRPGCARSISPAPRAPAGEGPLYHHIGLYAFRRAALDRFVALPPSPLERREQLEQLRALEAGMRIDVAIVDSVPLGVDTPADLETARAMLTSAS